MSTNLDSQTFPQFNIQVGNEMTWNVAPLLHEMKHALDQLIRHNKTAIIDLRSIPLAPGEEQTILDTLGRGEVHAQLDSLGRSEITETSYPGIWLVTHINEQDEIVSRFIEITTIPDILLSHKEDVMNSYERLVSLLEDDQVMNEPLVETQE